MKRTRLTDICIYHNASLWKVTSDDPGLYRRIMEVPPYHEVPHDLLKAFSKAYSRFLDKDVQVIDTGVVGIGDCVRGNTADGERVCGIVTAVDPIIVRVYEGRSERLWNVSL